MVFAVFAYRSREPRSLLESVDAFSKVEYNAEVMAWLEDG